MLSLEYVVKEGEFAIISQEISLGYLLRGRIYSQRKSIQQEGEVCSQEELTLIEGVFMDGNQNETKDMFLTLCFL